MKIKIDYVTNSSSEVFGIVIGDSMLVGGLISLMAALLNGYKADVTATQTEEVMGNASTMAEQIAEAVFEDAEKQEEIVKGGYGEARNTLNSAKQALERELEECKKTWEESEKTADKTDPGYEKLKSQYEEYIEYLNSQINKTEYQKQMIDYEEAQNQADINSKSEWVKQNQKDYIAVKEERAMLEAVEKGYDVPGYNTDAVKIRLEQLKEREKELSNILSNNDASIDYTAKDRGEIGPSKESRELTEKIRKEKERFEQEKKTANKEKRKILQAEMEKNIAEYQEQIYTANIYDLATKAAEGIQFGADAAIEGLSYVTGPAGKNIKTAYTAGKNIASGMGEGMADPENARKHLAKGILNATTEVLKEKFGDDKPWQAAATEILNEGLQSGLDASIEGKDVLDEMGKGLTKGVFNVGVDKGLDAIKDKLPIPKGSSVEIGDYSLEQITNNNPLVKGIAKTAAREVAGSKIKDALKEATVDEIGKELGFKDPE